MRNKLLDQGRLLAAFLVIIIHAPLPGVCGQIAESVSRVAVPFFFMISGYYSCGKSNDDLKKKAYRTRILLLWSVGMYFCWEILFSFYHGTTVQKLQQYFSAKTLFETFVLNTGVLLGHLWFLMALLYCYLIYGMWIQKISYNAKLAISIVLTAAFFLIREVMRDNGISDPVYYTRNFFFVGLPYFLIGNIIFEKRECLSKVKVYIWWLIAFAGIAAVIAERMLVGSCDLYYGTVASCVPLFVLAQSHRGQTNEHIAAWGSKYAGDIYIFHVMIIGVINIAASILGLLHNSVFLIIRPLAVLGACIVVAAVKNSITRAISSKK